MEERTKRAQVEALLDARLEQLTRTRAAMRASADGQRGAELSNLDNHPGDGASALHDEELDVTADMFMDEERLRIEEARRALADGSYGVCRECHKPIAAARLSAVPEAVRCLECQRHFEGFHRQRTV